MPRILTFTNQKGGVGKTTSALNVGACLSELGHNVLLVDLDPQGNLTQSLLPETPRDTIFTLLLEECSLEDALVHVKDRLSLIPCSAKFANFERQFAADADSQFVLKDFVESLLKASAGQIDYIVFDTPPALGLITLNALVASREVYIPMHSQEYSLTGLQQVMSVADKIKKRINTKLEIKGVFFTRHNPRKQISRNMIEVLKEDHPGLVMNTFVRVNVALEESPSLRLDVYRYAPESNGAADYRKLTKEIIQRK